MMSDNFGAWLRRMRKEAGMSQRDIADVLHISHTYLSKIEAGKTPPPGEGTLRGIASALCLDIDTVYRKAGRVPAAITRAFADGVDDDTYKAIMAVIRPQGMLQATEELPVLPIPHGVDV